LRKYRPGPEMARVAKANGRPHAEPVAAVAQRLAVASNDRPPHTHNRQRPLPIAMIGAAVVMSK
jgi:hypothetical protein